MIALPHAIQSIFVFAGWTAGAVSAAHASIPTSAESRAAEILREYAGLQVGNCGPGTETAASDVCFFRSQRAEAAAVLSPWQLQIGNCAAFATAHNDHMILFVNDKGSYFAFTDADECRYRLPGDFGDSMERLIFGHHLGTALPRDVQPFAAADGFAARRS